MKSIKKTARIAGLLYLLMFPLTIFSIFVASNLIVSGDAGRTANNILASEGLFRLAFMSDLAVQVVFIFLVLALYKLLKPVNKNHAALMVILALVGVPIAMLNMLNQFSALQLLHSAETLTVFDPDLLQAQAMFYLDLHKLGINIASIFWGLWLIPLGYLVFKSGYIPRIFGVLMVIGGIGYLVDFFTFFLFPNIEVTISQFTFIGELLLPLWLLIIGVKDHAQKNPALEHVKI